MTGFELTAKIIEALAWPLVVLVVAILLRSQLQSAVSRLVGVQFPGGSLEFERRVGELAEEELDLVGVFEAALEEPSANQDAIAEIIREPLHSVVTSYEELSRALAETTERLGLLPSRPRPSPVSMGATARRLRQEGYIDDSLANRLEELQKTRNLLVHGHEAPSSRSAAEYRALARDAIERLSALEPKESAQPTAPTAF